MQKPLPPKQPWKWKPLVRSRAIEWFWFAMAADISFLFLLGLLMHGERWLGAWSVTSVIVMACLAVGWWNRKKRRQEKADRLLP
jgi:hypothetical protein